MKIYILCEDQAKMGFMDKIFVTVQGVLNVEVGRPAWGLSLAEY